ncbi:MAG: hypothetical protein ACP5HZ_11470 [Ferrimicrobium sp.]
MVPEWVSSELVQPEPLQSEPTPPEPAPVGQVSEQDLPTSRRSPRDGQGSANREGMRARGASLRCGWVISGFRAYDLDVHLARVNPKGEDRLYLALAREDDGGAPRSVPLSRFVGVTIDGVAVVEICQPSRVIGPVVAGSSVFE